MMGVGDCSRIIIMKIDRNKILNKYGKRCGYCGTDIDLKSMQVDHIIPQENFEGCIRNIMHIPKFLLHLTLRDVHNIDNLMPACSFNPYAEKAYTVTLKSWEECLLYFLSFPSFS